MAGQATIVEKKVRMDNLDVIKYQLLTHCFLERISISDSGIECLAILARQGEVELTQFCNQIVNLDREDKLYKSAQSVRNVVNEAEKSRLIIKRGKNRKVIFINPELEIQSDGNILLDYKFLSLAA
jgi:hypothetical protein